MRSFKAGVAGLTLITLFFAAAAVAQEGTTPPAPKPATPAAPATPAKAPEAAAKSPEAAAKPAAAAAPAAAKVGPVSKSIIGEIVDPGCYLVNGAKGDGHKDCALACAKACQTLAVLEKKTNKLFILATERPGEDANRLVIDHIGHTVLVQGKVYTRGGVSGIMVASVEPYSAKAAGN
jgi:hypothetical protein